MNETAQVQASMWLMIVIQTLNAIDLPGHGKPGIGPKGHNRDNMVRQMPAPKTYVAIIVLWSTFGLLIDVGFGKAAAAFSWVVVLVALVGKALPGVNILNKDSTLNSNATPAAQSITRFLKIVGDLFNPNVAPSSGGDQIA